MTGAIKYFLLVVICFCVTIVIGSHSRGWLVNRLTQDFETLSATEKKQRLLEISELGAPAIQPMVDSLADRNREVARAAFDLLRQKQKGWSGLRRDDQQTRHKILVNALNRLGVNIPDDRRGWAIGLLHQTITASVAQNDETTRALYARANDTLELFTLSQRTGPSVLSDEALDPQTPKRLAIRATPLPVAMIETPNPAPPNSAAPWPADQQNLAAETGATHQQVQSSAALLDDRSQSTSARSAGPSQQHSFAATSSGGASVYRSGSPQLHPVPQGQAIILRRADQPQETSYQGVRVRRVNELVESPMETLDNRSVIRWLGNSEATLREKAKQELTRRGFNSNEISLAARIANDDVQSRIELVDVIAHSASIDPRPWLMMMLHDDNREVKLRVISVLVTMNDPAVRQKLRLLMNDQSDPIVAARLHRVLDRK